MYLKVSMSCVNLGGFECLNCHAQIKRDPTVQPYMAVSLASESSPEWVFYQDAQFCSVTCDSQHEDT